MVDQAGSAAGYPVAVDFPGLGAAEPEVEGWVAAGCQGLPVQDYPDSVGAARVVVGLVAQAQQEPQGLRRGRQDSPAQVPLWAERQPVRLRRKRRVHPDLRDLHKYHDRHGWKRAAFAE
jgi:hypothetical protein